MSNNKTEPQDLPQTRAWVDEYQRWRREQEAPAEAPADEGKDPSPPDLQAFIRKHGDWRRLPVNYFDREPVEDREKHWQNVRANGAYSVITPEEWKEWDQLMAEWRIRRGVA
jgi:hypothetical protein